MILYHYFVVEACPWLETWYHNASCIRLPVTIQNENKISFTYGDMFPTFSPCVQDGREYRDNVFTYSEILQLIDKYGLPQNWNPNGEYGPERYIEAQVWYDITSEIQV